MQIMGSQDGEQQSHFQSLARQSSFYNLTLDEVNNQLGGLGKPLGSMNLDELLKNVWSAESNQAIGVDIESSPRTGQMAPASGLQRQGSVTINRTLSKKTVDEVWRDIQQGQDENIKKMMAQERHPTFGEMTLEDFLVRAGALAEGSKMKGEVEHKGLDLSQEMCNVGSVASVDQMAGPQNYPQGQWLQYQYPQQSQPEQQNMMNAYVADHTVPQPLSVSPTPLLDVSFPENQVTSLSPLMGTLSDTQTPGRKRAAPGDAVQKTVERRQKRMIKNRESAARSRARKQAYTNELENKVSRLEEENERLKKQKEVERILHCAPLPEPKYQLRRTSSAPF